MLENISVKNFRSLTDVKDICITPITVLLGKNSSGKSSFLRLFPLFKQSTAARIRGSILLYGDFVDFGEFNTVKTSNSTHKTIDFSFSGRINAKNNASDIFLFEYDLYRDIDYKVDISISENTEEHYLYISSFIFYYENKTIKVTVNNKNTKISNITLNNKKIDDNLLQSLQIGYFIPSSFFPNILIKIDTDSYRSLESNYLLINYLESLFGETFFTKQEIFDIQRNFSLPKKEEVVDIFIQQYLGNKLENKERNYQFIKTLSDEKLDKLYEVMIINDFISVYYSINKDLRSTFQNTYYSKPIRANSERFYRNQPFVVNEVDPDGSNLIQFFSNMTVKHKQEFKSWMDENFQFHFDTNEQPGFKSIMIYEKDDIEHPHNITDMGFGYTQILPIVTQLWTFSNRIEKEHRHNDLIYTIEQPELHLHPAFQCKLINTFVKLIALGKKLDISIRFIVETHSETIINHIGKEISRKHISQDDVSLLIFSKNGISTEITPTKYNSEGILMNWPIGFFGEE